MALTLACYWPAGHFGFVLLDDAQAVSTNQMVQQGLTWPSLVWACKNFVNGNWQPVTTLSHMLDCQLWGPEAGNHHLTNVLLHTLNVLLLFLVLRRLTGALWRSALVAALFGWHPMHVESVAWISERKDVLSGLFFLLTLWAYGEYVRRGEGRTQRSSPLTPRSSLWYLLALLCFALGLMSKPMLVTLPCVLLLLDYWPLRRLEFRSKNPECRSQSRPPKAEPSHFILLLEKLPFFALSAADCVITLAAQKGAGAVAPLGMLPVSLRVENALTSGVVYVGKLFWPGAMAPLYPLPTAIPLWQAVGAGLLLGVLSVTVLWRVRQAPWLAVGWFWFLGMLVPVIGLVQVGDQSRADRYTYLPYVGLGLMLAWGVPALLTELVRGRGDPQAERRHPEPEAAASAAGLSRGRLGLGLAAAAALGAAWFGARAQLAYWQDNVKLFQHTIEITGQNEAARNTLGIALAQKRRLEEAAVQFQAALQVSPAHSRFRPETCSNLGRVYFDQHKWDEAVAMFAEALKANPDYTEARMHLALTYQARGEMDKAIAELKLAAAQEPGDMTVQGRLAGLLVKAGQAPEALAHCQALVAAQPQEPAAHFLLAGVYVSLNRPAEAIGSIRQALRLAPKTAAYLDHLARLLATCPEARLRNGAEAVELAQRACALSRHQNAGFLDTLSAAYAEVGRFAEALQAAEEARTLALAHQDREGAAEAARKLELYRAGQPYRELPKSE